MERDSPVERNGLRDAASWDARRGTPTGVRGPQPPACFGNFSAVKSSPPEAGESLRPTPAIPVSKSRWRGPGRWGHLSALAAGMLLLCLSMDWPVQWFCFLALVPLYFYNGQRGTTARFFMRNKEEFCNAPG